MNAKLIFNHNLKFPDFEISFFELPNHFLHFKTMPKLLVTYGSKCISIPTLPLKINYFGEQVKRHNHTTLGVSEIKISISVPWNH